MSDKRSQIIEASIDLFAGNGFWNTPTSKITKHAGVSTGTLFNYFDSKDALIDEVFLQLKQEQAAHIAAGYPEAGTVRAALEHIWFRFIDWGMRHPVRYRLLMQLKLSDLVSDAAQEQSAAGWSFAHGMVEAALASGMFGGLSAEYVTHLMLAQLDVAVTYATTHALTDMPLTRHIAGSFEIFWTGVTNPSATYSA